MENKKKRKENAGTNKENTKAGGRKKEGKLRNSERNHFKNLEQGQNKRKIKPMQRKKIKRA